MSNWRINLGLGPIRYVRSLGRAKRPGQPRRRRTGLGVLIAVVVTLGLIWLTCTGLAAWYNHQP